MEQIQEPVPNRWPLWKKLLFRFLAIYFLLFTTPWTWLDTIPGVSYITQYYYSLDNWVVNAANKYLFRIKDVLVPVAGSGDTSYGWAQLFWYLTMALAGSLIWTLADRRTPHYRQAEFWLRNIVRYYVAIVAFSYGIIKLFALQMPFPNLSQLATPLGDYLPMRLSWMFIGYSAPYQIFSGAMEVMVGLLLLNRSTVLTGALMGLGVFANVAMLNLSYDIPVKIYSLELFFSCVFLVLSDWKRVWSFLALNRDTPSGSLYELRLTKKWHRIGRVAAKLLFAVLFVVLPLIRSWQWQKQRLAETDAEPLKSGVYAVKTFVRNNDTIPVLASDSLIWKDVIIDKGGMGSVNTTDTLFRQRYRRGYFFYAPDSLKQTLELKRMPADSAAFLSLKYEIPDSKTIKLRTMLRGDSLFIELVRTQRHFQLTERQFHWLSEANR